MTHVNYNSIKLGKNEGARWHLIHNQRSYAFGEISRVLDVHCCCFNLKKMEGKCDFDPTLYVSNTIKKFNFVKVYNGDIP